MTPKTLNKERREKFTELILISELYTTSPLAEEGLAEAVDLLVSELVSASLSRSEVRGIEVAKKTDEEPPVYQLPENTAYNRGEQERPDKIAMMLAMIEFPGAKQQARIDALLNYFGVSFEKNVETKEWKSFAKYCLSELVEKGWKPEVFINWVKSQKGYPEFWSLKRMREDYPKAFVELEKRRGIVENVSEDSNGIPRSY